MKSLLQAHSRHTTQLASSAATFLTAGLLAACAATAPDSSASTVGLPLLHGWYEGEAVIYVTTDVSDADVARAKGANFAPRLAEALPPRGTLPGRSAVDKVYAVTNFEQGGVFASAPAPVGPANRDAAYSPLWQMVKVTWRAGHAPHTLKSQEDVLAAAEQGHLQVEPTAVVLNCPIVQRAGNGGLSGLSIGRTAP